MSSRDDAGTKVDDLLAPQFSTVLVSQKVATKIRHPAQVQLGFGYTGIKDMTLIPGGGGCFELSVDGELIYSKLKTGRFPDEKWVMETVGARLKELAKK